MPRHPEPECVIIYRQGPPKCCHTCDSYTQDGECERFGTEPPADFAATPGACPNWLMEIPF